MHNSKRHSRSGRDRGYRKTKPNRSPVEQLSAPQLLQFLRLLRDQRRRCASACDKPEPGDAWVTFQHNRSAKRHTQEMLDRFPKAEQAPHPLHRSKDRRRACVRGCRGLTSHDWRPTCSVEFIAGKDSDMLTQETARLLPEAKVGV